MRFLPNVRTSPSVHKHHHKRWRNQSRGKKRNKKQTWADAADVGKRVPAATTIDAGSTTGTQKGRPVRGDASWGRLPRGVRTC